MQTKENCQIRDQIYKTHRKEHHWRACTTERNKYNRLLKCHKKQVITKKIIDNCINTKELFKIVNKLTGSNTHNLLPWGRMSQETVEDFAQFFLNKITKIQQLFIGIPLYQHKKTDTLKFENFTHSHKTKFE